MFHVSLRSSSCTATVCSCYSTIPYGMARLTCRCLRLYGIFYIFFKQTPLIVPSTPGFENLTVCTYTATRSLSNAPINLQADTLLPCTPGRGVARVGISSQGKNWSRKISNFKQTFLKFLRKK